MASEAEYIANLRAGGIDESTIAYMADLRRESLLYHVTERDYGYETPDDQPTSDHPLFTPNWFEYPTQPPSPTPKPTPPSTPKSQPVVPSAFVTPAAMPTRRFPPPMRDPRRRRRVPSPVGFQDGTVSETSSSSSDSDDPF